MLILNSPQIVQETILKWKRSHQIAVVPTMGCLHEGHLQLVRRAKSFGSKVVATIFVNPLQFGANEDFDKYPRTMERDEALLRDLDVDLLFAPTKSDLYPEGFQTQVTVGPLSKHLCGALRANHFEGVATVCLKLFQITQADVAVFGEKDFQQLRVLEKMTEDFNLPLSIVREKTVRESDGLALSSRNRYLSESERELARRIPEGLENVRRYVKEMGEATVESVRTCLVSAWGTEIKPEYVEVVSSRDLVPLTPETTLGAVSFPRLILAVKIGNTRLIDNIPLFGEGE